MKSGKTLLLFAAVSILSAVSAQAVDIISVNFADGAMTSTALIMGTYGVEPAGNWNNVLGDTSSLINDSGSATMVDLDTTRPNGNALWPVDYTNTVLYAGIRENLSQSTHSSVTFY